MAKKTTKASPADAGREFITAWIATLPEGDLRTVVATQLTKEALAGDDLAAAVTFVGEGVLRNSDYSRKQDELQATLATQTEVNATLKERLDGWYATNQGKIANYDDMAAKNATLEAAAAHEPDPKVDPKVDPKAALPDGFDASKFVLQADLDKRDQLREREFLGFHRIANRLGLQHFADFGEVLDEDTILTHPNIQTLGFEKAYLDVYKDKIAARTQAQDEKAAAKIKADHRKEWETEQAETHARPYPIGAEAFDPGTLGPLHEAQGTQNGGGSAAVAAATKAYLEATVPSQRPPS